MRKFSRFEETRRARWSRLIEKTPQKTKELHSETLIRKLHFKASCQITWTTTWSPNLVKIGDITWSHRDTKFCSTTVKRYFTTERSVPVNFNFSQYLPHLRAISIVSLNIGYNMAVINQNVISLFSTKQVIGMPFYSGLAARIAQSTFPSGFSFAVFDVHSDRAEGPGGGGGVMNDIIGFLFDREITTRDILVRDFVFYSC